MNRLLPIFLIFLAASYPDPALTPGEVLPVTKETICVSGYSKTVRHTTSAMKMKVRLQYGIKRSESGKYVLDHLVPLQLAGRDSVSNLWPQEKEEAKRKDFVENWLKRQACSGKISLKDAQDKVANNWREIYKREHKPKQA